MIWTGTCGYCGHASSGPEQEGIAEELEQHFTIEHIGLPPTIEWSNDGPPVEPLPAAPSLEENLASVLEKLPPDQPVTASDLLAILRPDTMTVDAPASIPEPPAAGA